MSKNKAILRKKDDFQQKVYLTHGPDPAPGSGKWVLS